MKICPIQSESDGTGAKSTQSDAGGHTRGDATPASKPGRSRKDESLKQIYNFIRNHVCIPLRNSLCINEWRDMPGHLKINKVLQ